MVIASGTPIVLGVADDAATVRFGEEPREDTGWAGRRLLYVGQQPTFDLSFWCGSCQFLFQKLENAAPPESLVALQQRLTTPMDTIDEATVAAYGPLLQSGTYLPVLLQVEPRLVRAGREDDYFSVEQVSSWGFDAVTGLPEYPATLYFRTFDTVVDDDAHLYEFIVPMVPLSWNYSDRVDEYEVRMLDGEIPTAVAVSTLDVCAPATERPYATDLHTHWGFTHFLLDGHHKMEAAAKSGRPVRLLTLLSLDWSLASPDYLNRLVEIRRSKPQKRVPPARSDKQSP